MWSAKERSSGITSFLFSLGLSVSSSGLVQEVLWDSPAYEASITNGTKLVAVGGLAFSTGELSRAIMKAADGEPVRLLIEASKHQREVSLECPDGHRYPALEPIEGARRRLDEILAPRAAPGRG
jgi:predicted metalloprotease with PDZ domain